MLSTATKLKLATFTLLSVLVMAYTGVHYANLGGLAGQPGYYVVRLDLAQAGTELRYGVRRQALRVKQRGCCRCHHSPRDVPARHHRAKQPNLFVVEGQSKRGYGIQRQHPAKSLRLL